MVRRVVSLPPFFIALALATAALLPVTGCGSDSGGSGIECTPFTLCGEACVDIDSDPQHCGACANACAANEACEAGSCVAFCAAGETNCSGECVDVQNNANHCGACDNDCQHTAVCDSGSCVCRPGLIPCNGECIDPLSDPSHCGAYRLCGAPTGAPVCPYESP